MESLKEWATVVAALEDGVQTVLLRKGGILDVASGFKIETKKFPLFPTQEHQDYNHIKPEFHKYLEQVKINPPKTGFNRITSYAEILSEADISLDETIKKLSKFHIWSDSYINERKNWKPENPIKAVFLKVYKIPKVNTPLKSEYQGCKSWININEEIPVGKAVLSDKETESKLEEFKEIIR
ncbi:DUF1802 family protein [Candidatus Nitrosarchaeum limnium]|uniref:DUF1802 family protein n=1 Tax=Candidatus Nitrosarchaeum limnium BG20 TaxID=859192 RepID=S2E0C5_9ARCH|nr:DUF1802 family protein [Candidatus Nitrosarchaeum limnium]EPA04378.1 hypothetical protein BG20_I2292 [Candidatus Nitrosarchaeum limnium BG20]